MATFTYKAKTRTGQTVTGVLTAESHPAALRTLDDRSLFPLEVTEGSQAAKSVIIGRKKKVRLKALATLYSQLADLLRAGVPVLRALDVLARQSSDKLLSEILRDIHSDVSGGETLADAMAKHPNAFNELAVAMVRAGEQGGFLEDVLVRIAVFTERQDELRNKLLGSLVYPAVLALAGIGVVTFLMVGVVPKIRGFLNRVEKPWITDVIFWCSDFIGQRGMYIVLALAFCVALIVPYLKSEQGRVKWDRLKLKIPLLGDILLMVSLCRFCRILGTMLHNGVPILQALRVSKDSAGNVVLAAEIEKASEEVQKGRPLAAPLGASGLFPMDVIDMIAVAEESNSLETVLVQIADSNEVRTGRKIDLGVRLLEPLMLMFMAGIVMVIALALLVPIMRMSTAGVGH
ncbi:MAG TPA: type II secretion system F family protein [Phycisphaerae bacterium]|jgi:type II secretory pathway component PulF|nr:type II secretion system F family protein [Phycisphaerae bacterium]HOB75535.1 type II secretion system F family protein [Phycisphaerae bacterium]HOJ55874.1 type II secretion system F family protein [Phycisphaerae bacterium]HOL27138.1 type II secretion system F family protein [Phycisphaerae bacterium]HPP21545.1 type II secretion system F family protein [Phycisphaerae bacterium]